MILRLQVVGVLVAILGSILALTATSSFNALDSQPTCPPCFNCQLPVYKCYNYGSCNAHDGRCQCPIGFGGDDCTKPLCGALSDPNNERSSTPTPDEMCKCKEGWSGLNCNLCETDTACAPFLPPQLASNATCYKGGIVVNNNYQMCKVTNKKIVAMLPNRPAQVTFSCDRNTTSCNLQFWVGTKESFGCQLDNCKFAELNMSKNEKIVQKCEKIRCQCLKDRFLCGENNSIDIGDFLDEEIKGPGTFTCDGDKNCKFEEPAMNNLILSVFGDSSIELSCSSGECMHYSLVPGFERPNKPKPPVFKLLAGAGTLILSILTIVFCVLYRKPKPIDLTGNGYMPIDWDDESDGKLMQDHVPATLTFQDIGYRIGDQQVLTNLQGVARPGQLLAIMGASGAGKTSCLDILARRNKRGTVSGKILVNGEVISNRRFRRVVGYVDQEDTLMPTLTVYETVLNSAMLRLPRSMPNFAKRIRVIECLRELGILGIKDRRIGSAYKRGISGGEKRRVSIACEMVTSPSILFLDEPTSGLDAYNALNVVTCLAHLAKRYKRTLVLTIHQPRSNIFNMLDSLLLLSDGYVIYSGPTIDANRHFASLGYHCPPGYNIADYAVDLTQEEPNLNNADEEDEYADDVDAPLLFDSTNPVPTVESGRDSDGYLSEGGIRTLVASLVLGFKQSPIYQDLHEELVSASEGEFFVPTDDPNSDTVSLRSATSRPVKGFRKPTPLTQFSILAKRSFINLTRDPLLMLANYGMAIVLAVLCGLLYYQITDDIPGFQNRMGLFFFMCALFGFSCLTSLQVFQPERLLFMRERANGYYHPITYYLAKVLFDVFPLRLIPPLIMSVILYPMVGLNQTLDNFLKFLLVLTLFNLASASLCLCLGILISNLPLANLVASLTILASMLFSGLFLNPTTLPTHLRYLHQASIFHPALEALLVNEMRFMQLKDRKFGLEIDIPAATILSTFGFDASAYWPDVIKLALITVTLLLIGYFALHFRVKERR